MNIGIDIAVKRKPSSGVSMNTLEPGIYVMSNWGSRGGNSDGKTLILLVLKLESEKFAVALHPESVTPILRWENETLRRNQLNGDRGYFEPVSNLRIEATIGNEERSF